MTARSRVWRTAALLVAVLFAYCTAVQYNDPDPLRWALAYAAAGALAVWSAFRRVWRPAPAVLGAICLLWLLDWIPPVLRSRDWTGEEGRESGGLALVVLWCLTLLFVERD
ncbi:MAG TPA: transmembrane 220 family protein [Candidatus Polarisedimenticolaceae bacterium]|nr:transmembrane 220 family protein [Candidatus Polarisedimenticolaceae bacterium]